MSTKTQFLKGGLQLGLGQIAQQGLLFARNVLVARLLPPEQFGVALTFITVLSALDALSEVGIELYMTRSEDAEDPDLQSTLQTLLIARGLISAALMFAFAGPIATLFGAPDAVWAYRLLAAVPLLRGFLHLDLKRFERSLRFWPGIVNHLVAVALGTIVAVAVAYTARGYEAILAAYMVQKLSLVVGSRLLAERPYRLARRRDYAAKLFSFGTPLILNGMLLFATMQGDRIVIGAAMGPQELANYGVVSILTAGITAIVMRVTSSLYVPLLSKFKPGDDSYLRRFDLLGAMTAAIAIGTMAGFATIGLHLATLAFGPKYALSLAVVVALGIQSGFKILRSWRQFSFIASARTMNVLFVNMLAASGIVAAAAAVGLGHGAEVIAACMACGEIAATLLAVLLGSAADPRLRGVGVRYVSIALAFAALLVAGNAVLPDATGLQRALLLVILLAAAGLALVIASQPLRSLLTTLWSKRGGANRP